MELFVLCSKYLANFSALFTVPALGKWSDTCNSRLGRRYNISLCLFLCKDDILPTHFFVFQTTIYCADVGGPGALPGPPLLRTGEDHLAHLRGGNLSSNL